MRIPMKYLPFLIAGLFCMSSAVLAAPSQFKHQARNVNCEACHNTAAPVSAAKSKSCMKCHTYEAVAAKTAKMNPNPHDSHAGQLRCTLCHKEHSDSVVYCRECHKNKDDQRFNFKTP